VERDIDFSYSFQNTDFPTVKYQKVY